jgi:DNA-binding transcriptional LysR family regulator
MDFRDLRYFEAIGELQHLGRAAKLLHRSQPALTTSVRRLEADCGAALFERVGRGIRLTEAGKILLRRARQMRFDMEDTRRELASLGSGLSGHIRIGIVPTAAQFLLPSVARDLLREAPAVTLRTTVALVDAMKPQLLAGELDMMIATQSETAAGLSSKLLLEDAIVVAASERHEVFKSNASLKELTAYKWALQPPGAPTRDWLDGVFDAKGLPRPQVQVETSTLLGLPALIFETGLLSFISRHHLQGPNRIRGLKELPVRSAVMRRRLVVTYRSSAFLSPASKRLIELFLRTAKSL